MSNFKKTLEGMEVEVVKVWLQDSHLMAVLMPEAIDLILDAVIEALPDYPDPNEWFRYGDWHRSRFETIGMIEDMLEAAKSTNAKEDE